MVLHEVKTLLVEFIHSSPKSTTIGKDTVNLVCVKMAKCPLKFVKNGLTLIHTTVGGCGSYMGFVITETFLLVAGQFWLS